MDKRICVYEAGATDFAGNGLGTICPTECTVHWTLNGEYSVEIVHPIDQWNKYERLIKNGRTVVVPVPDQPTMRIQKTVAEQTLSTYTIATRKSRLRLRSGPGTDYRCLGYYAKGKRVSLIAKTNSNWYEVTAPDGKHGYMSASYLSYYGTTTRQTAAEEVLHNLPMRPQPFDIYAIDPDVDKVTVRARHVFYRLADNLVLSLEIANKTAAQAVSAIFASAIDQNHGASWYCDATDALSFEDEITGRNIVDCLIGDKGICDTYNLKLHVDWFDIYLLKSLGEDRGVQIRYAKNLLGITGGLDESDVATRIVPVGQTKDGKPLYLSGTTYLESPKANLYPRPKYSYLSVSDAKVGSKVDGVKLTTTTARSRMRAAAQAKLDAGCDTPTCSMQVDMVLLRDDPRYQDYVDLEYICPGDMLTLIVPQYGINLSVLHSEYEYDALSEHYVSNTIGSPSINLGNSGISSRQLGGGSVTSSKIAPGAVGGSALADECLDTRHLQADSINTDALQANSVTALKITSGAVKTDKLDAAAVTAEKIAAKAVEADKIAADAVTAEKIAAKAVEADKIAADAVTAEKIAAKAVEADKIAADAVTAEKIAAKAVEATKIAAGAVTTEKLAAACVRAGNIAAGAISADSAIIADGAIGTAKIALGAITTALIRSGAVDTAQIKDGSITDAKIVSLNADVISSGTLATDRLILTGADGLIYEINATSAGLTAAQLTEEQYKRQINGTVIVARSLTAEQIAAAAITANEIAAGAITAAKIAADAVDASKIKAGSITTDRLAANVGQTLDLSSNNAIRAVVGDMHDLRYKINVVSSKSAFDAGTDSITLNATAYMDGTPINDFLDDDAYTWTRVSLDEQADAQWSATGKSITLTRAEVYRYATYHCSLQWAGEIADGIYYTDNDGALLTDENGAVLIFA